MYPDKPYAKPISSFQFPVQIIAEEPDAPPLETICINTYWLAYLRGCAKQLLNPATWATDDQTDIDMVQQKTYNLIGLMQDGVSGCGLSGDFPDWDFGIGENAQSTLAFDGYTSSGLACRMNAGYFLNPGIIKGCRLDDAVWVGGTIDQLFIFATQTTQIDLIDCENQAHSATGTYFSLDTFDVEHPVNIKEISFTSPYSAEGFFMLRIVSNWQCGPA